MIEELTKDEMMAEALSNNEILDSVFKIATKKIEINNVGKYSFIYFTFFLILNFNFFP